LVSNRILARTLSRTCQSTVGLPDQLEANSACGSLLVKPGLSATAPSLRPTTPYFVPPSLDEQFGFTQRIKYLAVEQLAALVLGVAQSMGVSLSRILIDYTELYLYYTCSQYIIVQILLLV
jgi:hypothetical protein